LGERGKLLALGTSRVLEGHPEGWKERGEERDSERGGFYPPNEEQGRQRTSQKNQSGKPDRRALQSKKETLPESVRTLRGRKGRKGVFEGRYTPIPFAGKRPSGKKKGGVVIDIKKNQGNVSAHGKKGGELRREQSVHIGRKKIRLTSRGGEVDQGSGCQQKRRGKRRKTPTSRVLGGRIKKDKKCNAWSRGGGRSHVPVRKKGRGTLREGKGKSFAIALDDEENQMGEKRGGGGRERKAFLAPSKQGRRNSYQRLTHSLGGEKGGTTEKRDERNWSQGAQVQRLLFGKINGNGAREAVLCLEGGGSS